MIINGYEIQKGFNINDKKQAFTNQILAGEKTVETREKHTLDSLIGKRVAIIRTGKGKATIVGICKIAGFVEYLTEDDFNKAYANHRVASGSTFDFAHSKSGMKVGYILEDVEAIEPMVCKAKGIVIRNI